MGVITTQDISTFGAGIVALFFVFSLLAFSIVKLVPILSKINTQLEIANKKEDVISKLVTSVDGLTAIETLRHSDLRDLKADIGLHDDNAKKITESVGRLETKIDNLNTKIFLLLKEKVEEKK